MKLLILGYSDFSKRRILPILGKKFYKINLGIASRTRFKKDTLKNILWFNDYKKAIELFQPDIIYISLPNSKHYYWSKYALKKKINVIVNKPIYLKIKN